MQFVLVLDGEGEVGEGEEEEEGERGGQGGYMIVDIGVAICFSVFFFLECFVVKNSLFDLVKKRGYFFALQHCGLRNA